MPLFARRCMPQLVERAENYMGSNANGAQTYLKTFHSLGESVKERMPEGSENLRDAGKKSYHNLGSGRTSSKGGRGGRKKGTSLETMARHLVVGGAKKTRQENQVGKNLSQLTKKGPKEKRQEATKKHMQNIK